MTGNKRGNILTENIIFLIITLMFVIILFVFVAGASSKTSLIEEVQAKKIALLLDSAKPETIILLNVNDVLDKKESGIEDKDVFRVSGNTVTVKLSGDSGYAYSFFNDAQVNIEIEESLDGFLKITIK